jgi:hypothetical protein
MPMHIFGQKKTAKTGPKKPKIGKKYKNGQKITNKSNNITTNLHIIVSKVISVAR